MPPSIASSITALSLPPIQAGTPTSVGGGAGAGSGASSYPTLLSASPAALAPTPAPAPALQTMAPQTPPLFDDSASDTALLQLASHVDRTKLEALGIPSDVTPEQLLAMMRGLGIKPSVLLKHGLISWRDLCDFKRARATAGGGRCGWGWGRGWGKCGRRRRMRAHMARSNGGGAGAHAGRCHGGRRKGLFRRLASAWRARRANRRQRRANRRAQRYGNAQNVMPQIAAGEVVVLGTVSQVQAMQQGGKATGPVYVPVTTAVPAPVTTGQTTQYYALA